MKKLITWPRDIFAEGLDRAPSKASKWMPSWYKELSPYKGGSNKFSFPEDGGTFATVKKCIPFLDAITAGYIFQLDQDVVVEDEIRNGEIFKVFKWQRGERNIVNSHPSFQHFNFPLTDDFYSVAFKWNNFWTLTTPPGYSIFYMHPVNRIDLPFYTLSGFVDADAYQGTVTFPFFLKKDFTGVIPAGTPIAQGIPVKRENWELEVQKFDQLKDIKHNYAAGVAIINFYKKFFWQRKKY